MKIKDLKRNSSRNKIIIVLADEIGNAIEAGRFAVRNLFDINSKIVLLQAYQNPRYGNAMLRDLSSMLEKIAIEDLSLIERALIKEFELSPESVIKNAFEGELSEVLKNEFTDKADISLVIGINSYESSKMYPYRKIVNAAVKSGIRPLVIVDESITIIERNSMVLYTENDKIIDSNYHSFLKEIKLKNKLRMTMYTLEKTGKFTPSPETASHFTKVNGAIYKGVSKGENILRKELKKLASNKQIHNENTY